MKFGITAVLLNVSRVVQYRSILGPQYFPNDLNRCSRCKSPPFRLTRESLLFLQLPVLLSAVQFRDEDKNYCQATPGNNSTASSLIIWLLVSQEEIRREPVGNRGDAVSNGNQGGSLGPWPRYDGGLPGYLKLFKSVSTIIQRLKIIQRSYIKADEWARDQQDHAEVARPNIESCDHNHTPNKREKNGHNYVVSVL